MISISIAKEYLLRVKEKLLVVPVVYFANSFYKSRKLKNELKKLSEYYDSKIKVKQFFYSEQTSIDNFKKKLCELKPGFLPKKSGELRVFWVGANRDQDESGFLQALRSIADVFEFHNWSGSYGQWYWDHFGRVKVYEESIVDLNDKCLISQIKKCHEKGGLDLVMGQMWANYLSVDALNEIQQLGVPVINISMDDRLPDNWGYKKSVRLGAVGLVSVTDLVLTTSSETCAWYGAEDGNAIFWPLASDPGVFSPEENNIRDIDVLFIGNKYGIRESIVNKLRKEGVDVECYGAGWPNGPATAEQSAALFKRAKIIFGVGNIGYCHDVFTMKLRDFDAPMSGGLYLTHRTPDLSKLYIEGVDIECYSTPKEAAEKIKFYLSNLEQLEKIARNGYQKAQERDTWKNRLESTFIKIGIIEVAPLCDK